MTLFKPGASSRSAYTIVVTALAVVLCLLVSCYGRSPKEEPDKHKKDKNNEHPVSGVIGGYDLRHPQVLKLPAQLDEISGLAWNEKDSTLLAIVDEVGVLYKIDPANPLHIQRWKFGPSGDYEDLALVGDDLFILRSDGAIFKVRFSNDGASDTKVFDFPEKGSEFESLCYDARTGQLLMICKDCESDKKKLLSTYAFLPDSLRFTSYSHHIDAKAIAERLNEKTIKFKPSAATFHPTTGQLYIVSAINDVLVTADESGEITDVATLERKLYKQPEGIAFSPRGTLFISNESADAGAATILIFLPDAVQQ